MNDSTGGYSCAFCRFWSFDLRTMMRHEEACHEEQIRDQHRAEWGHELGSAECHWHDGRDEEAPKA